MREIGTTKDEEESVPQVDTPVNLLPDLTVYGIQEVDKGVCQDTAANRRILRTNKFKWEQVLDQYGKPSGNIQAQSKEMLLARSQAAMEQRKNLLRNPNDPNSDYLTGMDLLLEDHTDDYIPSWVMAATRHWNEVARVRMGQAPGDKPYRPALEGPPARCRFKRSDSLRCLNWYGGRKTESGLCRLHLTTTHGKDAHLDMLETARVRVRMASVTAVDVLEEIMETAESEPVRLKAATEILDRAGVRGGIEIDQNVAVEVKPARDIVLDRLNKLAEAESRAEAERQAKAEAEAENIIDAEVVEDDDTQPTN